MIRRKTAREAEASRYHGGPILVPPPVYKGIMVPRGLRGEEGGYIAPNVLTSRTTKISVLENAFLYMENWNGDSI